MLVYLLSELDLATLMDQNYSQRENDGPYPLCFHPSPAEHDLKLGQMPTHFKLALDSKKHLVYLFSDLTLPCVLRQKAAPTMLQGDVDASLERSHL